MKFGIKHRQTGMFFQGFGVQSNAPLWGAEIAAKRFDKESAKQQALLFRCRDIAAQVKPVALAA